MIVDDEKGAREGLFLMLKAYEQLEVVGICTNGLEAITQIDTLRPDLVFLDIQMPQVSGFEVVNSLEPPLPAFVFITAFDEYALKAFEVHALDYLLKPFTKKRLDEAIAHVSMFLDKEKGVPKETRRIVKLPADNASSDGVVDSDELSDKLVIKTDGRLYFIEWTSVIWIQAYDYYVKVHTKDKYYLVRESMKSMEARLPAPAFLRVHKSGIVNTSFIHSIEPVANNDHLITLQGGVKVKSSRSYSASLQKWLM
ncbi:Two-component system, LytT family, response regulator [Imperialibacter sp. EC-SDR9]|nr:Two-component system, LytT family, response regulator [Imperialibacter sp. 75]CAD5297611.1 Two-component system, LytT family, response regulator [Imperialibacter sp. 89]VVT02433.1 Two-component system, LytT family, response regulator [Imperialibacter sp. EC-SDR9]